MTREEELHYALLKAEEKIKALQRRMEWKDAAYKAQGKATYDINAKYARLERKHLRLADIVMNITSKGRKAKAMENMLHLIEQRDKFYDEARVLQTKYRETYAKMVKLEKEQAKCKS